MAYDWSSLPDEVQAGVERYIGPVLAAEPITGGQNNDVAAVLHTETGPVFGKGVRGISRRMRFLRNEVAAAPVVGGLGPALRCAVDRVGADGGGWYVAVFDYVAGRPADLRPGSVDLPIIVAVLARLAARPAPDLQSLADRWSGPVDWWRQAGDLAPVDVAGWDIDAMDQLAAAAPDAVDGDRLAHTDLHADQVLIDNDSQAHVIDWAWPAAAAPWVDTAYASIRLVEAGHSAADAEAWARTVPTWDDTTPGQVTAFAAYVAGLWTVRAAQEPSRGARARAAAARTYAASNLTAARTRRT